MNSLLANNFISTHALLAAIKDLVPNCRVYFAGSSEMLAMTGAVNLMRRFKPALTVAVYHDLDNAKKCAEIIKSANPKYKIKFRGFYGYFEPARPYMVFAY
jgi:hypothetical protein